MKPLRVLEALEHGTSRESRKAQLFDAAREMLSHGTPSNVVLALMDGIQDSAHVVMTSSHYLASMTAFEENFKACKDRNVQLESTVNQQGRMFDNTVRALQSVLDKLVVLGSLTKTADQAACRDDLQKMVISMRDSLPISSVAGMLGAEVGAAPELHPNCKSGHHHVNVFQASLCDRKRLKVGNAKRRKRSRK
jgi:hypothetical protein